MSRKLLALMVVAMFVAVVSADCNNSSESNESDSKEQKCGKNEELALCGTMCEPSCRDQKPNPRFCPAIMCTKFTEACRCKKGTYRDDARNCVERDACKKN